MSKGKKYSNFDEIDRDLKILYLQSEIAKEELKLGFRGAKEDLKPSNLISNFFGGSDNSSILLKFATPLISYGIGKLVSRR